MDGRSTASSTDEYDTAAPHRAAVVPERLLHSPLVAPWATVTHLVGTDGSEASEALCAFLGETVVPDDTVEVANVLTGSGAEAAKGGEEALAAFEDTFDDRVTVSTRQVNRGRAPSTEIVEMAREIEADQTVVGLGQHSRTERIIFGSVAQSLFKAVDRPMTLVPLPEYTVAETADTAPR